MKKTVIALSGLFLLLLGLELAIRRRAASDLGDWQTRPLPPPDPQATRTVVLGDSIAFGPDLAAEQAWPALLEKRLQQVSPDQRWQVINAGVPGNTSADAYARFDRHVRAYRPHLGVSFFGWNTGRMNSGAGELRSEGRPAPTTRPNSFRTHPPHFVLIALGLNDSRQVYRAIDERRMAAFLRHESFTETYGLGKFYLFRAILNRLAPLPEVDYSIQREADGPRVPPDTFTSLLSWIVNASKRIPAQPILLSLTPISEELDPARGSEFARWSEYNALVGEVASTLQVPLIDVSRPFPDANYWAADGVHLSAVGETEIAERVWTGLTAVFNH